MIFPDKLLKQIPETTYLTTDNTYRYRVIIRIMFIIMKEFNIGYMPKILLKKFKPMTVLKTIH